MQIRQMKDCLLPVQQQTAFKPQSQIAAKRHGLDHGINCSNYTLQAS